MKKNFKDTDLSPRDGGRTPRFSRDRDEPMMSSRSSNRSSSASLLFRSSVLAQNDLPEAKSPYGPLTHKVRQIVPQEIACMVGCKGEKCKYCTSNWPPEDMAINGIYSHWYFIDVNNLLLWDFDYCRFYILIFN